MRIFSSARIAVIDADPERRATLCSALADFGMLRLYPLATFDEARELAGSAAFDLCIVNASGLPGGSLVPLYPFDPALAPAILIAPSVDGKTVRAALAHGYRLVMPAPAVPRLVYRRIGSILQKVRRANRVGAPELALSTSARTPALQQG